ncbi:MAG: amidohydrolase family protein [Thermodesulfobacteriota bacterium]
MRYRDFTPLPVIDAHVHVFPPKLFRAVKRWFETHAWRFHSDGTAEDFLEAQFEAGAAGLVLLSYAHRPELSPSLNEFTAGLVKKFPNTVGLAAVHPGDPNPREVLYRAFEVGGLAGAKIHCHVLGVAPDDPALFPIYETLIGLEGVLVIHGGREPAIDAYGLDVRAITGAARMARVLERYPELKVVVCHLGVDETEAFYALLPRHPNLYLDTAMMLTGYLPVEISPERLERHADRILFGTDYPHIPYAMETELKGLLDLNLSPAAARKILHENARRLFFRDGPAGS